MCADWISGEIDCKRVYLMIGHSGPACLLTSQHCSVHCKSKTDSNVFSS